MNATTLLAAAFVVVGLFACDRHETAGSATPAAAPPSTAPTTTPSAPSAAAGSGSAAGSPEALIAAMLDYSDKMVPILIGFSGDCDATAKRMLSLEPLAKVIRAQGDALDADPATRDAFREQMRATKDSALARIDANLKTLGATREDMDRKQAELKKTCGGNAAYVDAEQRVGLKKKKS